LKILDRLEVSVGSLLELCRELQAVNTGLQREKELWQQERQQLLREIDSILERLDAIHLEKP
jgi:hypothetical protein